MADTTEQHVPEGDAAAAEVEGAAAGDALANAVSGTVEAAAESGAGVSDVAGADVADAEATDLTAVAQESAPEASGPVRRWYVVQAYSGYENKVKLSLLERIKQAGMDDHFGEILIPKENVQETKAGSRRVTSRNFYPGYIFVHMHLTEHSWHVVKDTPKVSGFVGGRHPSPVPESEIRLITQQVAEGAAKPKPRVVFEQGDHVRVIDGAFANFTGSIEEVKPEKQKVRVLVSIFGRATPVELDYGQVEKTV